MDSRSRLETSRPAASAMLLDEADSPAPITDVARLPVGVSDRIDSAGVDRFLAASGDLAALSEWFGEGSGLLRCDEAARLLSSAVGEIDRLLGDQINAILHHPDFQKLEASWRGIEYLARRAYEENTDAIQVRLLSVSWKEVERDLECAIEFDQSEVFKKIYEDEFGMPGGTPYGLIVGDYEIEPRPRAGHPHDDVEVLRRLSGVAAAAFCPLIVGAAPGMFGLKRFSELERVKEVASVFQLDDFIKWRSFRETMDSRFIGIAAPRVLMRRPHESAGVRRARFPFREEVAGPDPDKYLWGNAAYTMAEVVMRAFAESGWLADIRGVRRDIESGGIVTGLPDLDFDTDRPGVAARPPLDASISEEEEAELHQLGFLSLAACKGTPYAAYYGCSSAHKPAVYSSPEATQNARFSAMLNYTLCVSRFAHHLKVLARDKVGSFNSADECQFFLQRWLTNYVSPDNDASARVRARLPLRSAEVEVQPDPSKPGAYHCVMRLAPHYQLDEIAPSLRLDTSLPANAT